MLNFFFFLTNTAVVVFFILIGGAIPLVERKILSLTHRRVGPKNVGFKGRFQFIADAIKLLVKFFLLPKNTNKFFFLYTPIFVLNLNLFLVCNVYWFFNVTLSQVEYQIVYLLVLELLNGIFFFYIGFFVKNKYTLISATRIFNTQFVLELLTSFFFTFVYFLNNSFCVNNFSTLNSSSFSVFKFCLFTPFFFFLFLFFIKKTPFDFVEAETELIMGFHTEHSGFLAGALILIEYLHFFFWIFFFTNLCF